MNVYEAHKANPVLFRQFSLKDILFLHYKCPQKDKLIELYSPYNQLTFSIGGKKIFHQGDKSWTISKDSGFLLRRTGYVEELHGEFNEWEILAFYLKDDYLKKIFEEFRPNLPLNGLPDVPRDMIIPINVDDRIRNCYQSLLPYFRLKNRPPESIIESKFKELLYNLLINPENKALLSYINSLSNGYRTPVWEVMEANFMYDLSISEYAGLSCRSLAKFKRDFKEYYHTTPQKWLIGKRLERARINLESTEKPIGQIAFENGFKSISYFSRKFKEHYGLSPLNYRSAAK